MFIVDINYTAPLEEIEKYRDAHVEYLKRYLATNTFLITGKKASGNGGILIVMADTQQQVQKIIIEDPFNQHNLADMTITEFSHARHIPQLDGLLGKGI